MRPCRVQDCLTWYEILEQQLPLALEPDFRKTLESHLDKPRLFCSSDRAFYFIALYYSWTRMTASGKFPYGWLWIYAFKWYWRINTSATVLVGKAPNSTTRLSVQERSSSSRTFHVTAQNQWRIKQNSFLSMF